MPGRLVFSLGLLIALFTASQFVERRVFPQGSPAKQAPDATQDEQRTKPEPPAFPETTGAQRPQFRAEVEQIVIYAAVYDKIGQLVSGLGKDQFTVFEDKVPQEITYFGAEDMPSTVGVVIDRSAA